MTYYGTKLTLAIVLISLTFGQTFEPNNCFKPSLGADDHCQMCKADYSNWEVTANYGLRFPMQTLGASTSSPNDADLRLKCSKNQPGSAPDCLHTMIDKCEIYDKYGRCIRCACDYGFIANTTSPVGFIGGSPQLQHCQENELRIIYCDTYNQLGNCIRCKWNQHPDDSSISGNDNRDPHSKINLKKDIMNLDFGLYNGKCYDNTGDDTDWKNDNKITNCAEYSSDPTNPYCIKCHTRPFDMDSNREFSAPGTTNSLGYFRKIHLDYYISDERTEVNPNIRACKRFPSNFVGRPILLQKIDFVTPLDNKYIINAGNSDTNGFLCQKSYLTKEYVKINACGKKVTDNTNCDASKNNLEKNFFLCAEKQDKCDQYEVEDASYDTLGISLTGKPSFPYKVATKCKLCEANFKPDINGACKSVLDIPNLQKCQVLKTSLTGTLSCNLCDGTLARQIYQTPDVNGNQFCTIKTGGAGIHTIEQCQYYNIDAFQSSDEKVEAFDIDRFKCWRCNANYAMVDAKLPTTIAAQTPDEKKYFNIKCLWIGNKYRPASKFSVPPGCRKLKYEATASNTNDDTRQVSCQQEAQFCDTDNGFAYDNNDGVKSCGCESAQFNSPQYRGSCVQTTAGSSANIDNCVTFYSKSLKQCTQCKTGTGTPSTTQPYYLSDSWTECITKLTTTQDDKCIARTAKNLCRLCEPTHYLDEDTHFCIPNVKTSDQNNAQNYNIQYCSFGKRSSPTSEIPITCYACHIGFKYNSAGKVNPGNVENDRYCKAKALKGKVDCTEYNQYDGKCICGSGMVDAWFTDNKRRCVTAIPKCRVYDLSMNRCFECEREGANQLGVTKDGKCETSRCNGRIGMSYDGKWVCVDTWSDDCEYYGFDKRCIKCKATFRLTSTGACTKNCVAPQENVKLFNGIYGEDELNGIDGCAKLQNANFERQEECKLYRFIKFTGTNDDAECYQCKPGNILAPTPPEDKANGLFRCEPSNSLIQDYVDTLPSFKCSRGEIVVDSTPKGCLKENDEFKLPCHLKATIKQVPTVLDYGQVCEGANANCITKCIDNTATAPKRVANCQTYLGDGATFNNLAVDLACCICRKGYKGYKSYTDATTNQPTEGNNKCDKTICLKLTAETFCDKIDHLGACLTCVTNYQLTPQRKCVKTCPVVNGVTEINSTPGDIFTGYYETYKGCIPSEGTNTKFAKGADADSGCAVWKYIYNVAATIKDHVECIQCQTGWILTQKAADVNQKQCVKLTEINRISTVTADHNCRVLDFHKCDQMKIKPDAEDICVPKMLNGVDPFNIDWGYYCQGATPESCQPKCIDNSGVNKVGNCKSYTKIDGLKSFLNSLDSVTDRCCVCKKGYLATNQNNEAISEANIQEYLFNDTPCEIKNCKPDPSKPTASEKCYRKAANGKCNQCHVGYKLLIPEGQCITLLPDHTYEAKGLVVSPGDLLLVGQTVQVDIVVPNNIKIGDFEKIDANNDKKCKIFYIKSTMEQNIGLAINYNCIECVNPLFAIKAGSCQTKNVDNCVFEDAGGKCERNKLSCRITGDFAMTSTNAIDFTCQANLNLVPNCKAYVRDTADGGQNQITAANLCCVCRDGYVAKNAAGNEISSPSPTGACAIKTCTEKYDCPRKTEDTDAGKCMSCPTNLPRLKLSNRKCIENTEVACSLDQQVFIKFDGDLEWTSACQDLTLALTENFDFIGGNCLYYTAPKDSIVITNMKCQYCKKDFVQVPQQNGKMKCIIKADLAQLTKQTVDAKCNIMGKRQCKSDGDKDVCLLKVVAGQNDYGYTQEKDLVKKCIINSVPDKVPNCRNYYTNGASPAITLLLQPSDQKCCECQNGYDKVQVGSDEVGKCKITACEQRCEIKDQFHNNNWCVKCKDNFYLKPDRSCVALCAETEQIVEAFTGFYDFVKACGKKYKDDESTDLFIKPKNQIVGEKVVRQYENCAIWNFKSVGTDTFNGIECVQCPTDFVLNTLQDQPNKQRCISLDYSGKFIDSSDKCRIVDKVPKSGSIALCVEDQCIPGYSYAKDSTDNKGKCLENDKAVKTGTDTTKTVNYCKSYLSAGKAGVDTSKTATAYSFSNRCCSCYEGFEPEIDETITDECKIKACKRYTLKKDIADANNQNCQTKSFGDPKTVDTCAWCLPGYNFKSEDAPQKQCYEHKGQHLACMSLNNNLGCNMCAQPWVLSIATQDAAGADDTCVLKTDKCIAYHLNANSNKLGQCKKCEHTHYLDTNQKCVAKIHGCNTMVERTGEVNVEWDMLRPRCSVCLNEWNKIEGQCFYGCSRIKKVWQEAEAIYSPQCCTCQAGFRMKVQETGECEKCLENDKCLECSTQAKLCTRCKQGYWLNNGVCTAHTLATCVTMSQGQCASCNVPEFYLENGSCVKRTVVTNCVSYMPNTDDCQACDANSYKSATRVCTIYQNKNNCQTMEPTKTKDVCDKCNDGNIDGTDIAYFRNAAGGCSAGKKQNCVAYDQTTQTEDKCRRCKTGFGLSYNYLQCLDNSIISNEGGTPNCFIYSQKVGDSKPVCANCNDGLDLTSSSYTLIANEYEVRRKCQKLQYCKTGVMIRKGMDEYYKCIECAAATTNGGSTQIARLLRVQKLRTKETALNLIDSNTNTDDAPQCKINPANAVKECAIYDAADTGVNFCQQCHGDHRPEQIKMDAAGTPTVGGRWCQPISIFCNIKACSIYQYGSGYEWLKCFSCKQTLGNITDVTYGLNSYTYVCDSLKVTGNDGSTNFNDLSDPEGLGGVGKDGGLFATNNSPIEVTKPSDDTSGFINSFGFELILFVFLGLVAFFV